MMINHAAGRTFRFYLALSYSLFVLVGAGMVGIFWFTQQEKAGDDALLLQVEERARLMASLQDFSILPDEGNLTPETTTALNETLRVLYISNDLNIQRLSDLSVDDAQRKKALELATKAMNLGYTVSQKTATGGLQGYHMLYAAAPVFNQDHQVSGLVCLILPVGEFQAHLGRSYLELIGPGILLVLVGVGLGLGLAAMFSQPVKRASTMAGRVADGDYSVRLPIQGPSELRSLSSNLNQMAEDLQKQEGVRRQILANMAHELSRPLGALRLGIDSLRSGAIHQPELSDDLLRELSRTVQNMNSLVDDLELASHARMEELRLNLQPVMMDQVMESLRSRFWLAAEAHNVNLAVEIPETLPPVLGDEMRLNQIFGNLLDNAFKFTPSGGKVTLAAECREDQVEVTVSDTGIGIRKEDMEHIFEPFYQGSGIKMTNRGVGLGLSIVKQLVQAHHGKIFLENHPGGGLTARVLLPVAHGNFMPGD